MIQIDKTYNTLTRGILKAGKTQRRLTWKYTVYRTQHPHQTPILLAIYCFPTTYKSIALRVIETIASQFPWSYDISISTVTDIYAKIHTIRKALRQTITQSYKLRRQHLIARAIALELNSDYGQEKAIKQLIIIENQRSLHAAIKYHFNPTFKSSLSTIQILVDNKDWNNILKDKSVQWKQIMDWNEIETSLIKRNVDYLS